MCFCDVYVVNIGGWGVDHPFLSDCLCGKSFRAPMIVKMQKRVGTYSKQVDDLIDLRKNVCSCACSTMRFERLIDGIEAYEKVKILRKKYAGNPDMLLPMKSFLESVAEMPLTDAELPWHDMMNGAVGLLHLNDISRKKWPREKQQWIENMNF